MKLLNGDAQTTLAAPIDADDTSLEIVPVGGSPAPSSVPFRLWIGNEMMRVTAISGGSNEIYTVNRHWENTPAEAHGAGDVVLYPRVPPGFDVKAGALFPLIAGGISIPGATGEQTHDIVVFDPPIVGPEIVFFQDGDGNSHVVWFPLP